MARRPRPRPSARSRPWGVYLLAAGACLVAVGIAFVLFWPGLQTWMWKGQLHSDDPRVRREAKQNLVASDYAGLNDMLYAVLVDPGESFFVRTQAGDVLVKRQRLTFVERALRSDDLDARTAPLAVLHAQARDLGQDWFRRNYVDDPMFRVRETLLAWLGRDGDLTRTPAIEMAVVLGLEEAMPALREMARLPRAGALTSDEQRIVTTAARALLRLGDCQSIPPMVELAENAEDDLVRLRLVQVVYDAVLAPQPTCPDVLPEDTVKCVVLAGLDAPPNTRHGALLILRQRPAWVEEVEDRLLAILDGQTDDTDFVRRAALGALAAGRSDAFVARLPRYFHADDPFIRSEAVVASRHYALEPEYASRFESCWIGVVRDETQNENALNSAMGGLRDVAGKWVGLPEELTRPGPQRAQAMAAFRAELLGRGESHGVDRISWSDAWFRWLGEHLGLGTDEIESAVATRDAFWKAAAGDDVAGARRALEDATVRVQGLFTYEEGWLAGG